MTTRSNKPAAPNAGIASRLTIERHWPGVGGEPERSYTPLNFLALTSRDFVATR
jgi:hypothetical protein